jgi:type I restriction enzyme, S subunit
VSQKKYPHYQAVQGSWFTQIPTHWEMLSSNRVFEQKREPAVADDEQLSVTQKYGVMPQSLFMAMDDRKVTLALAGTDNFKHVDEGDFVISLRSFEGGIELSHYNGCISPAYTCLRARKPIGDGYYKFTMKSKDFISALQSVTQGIRDGKNISYAEFSKLSIPYPPVEEQAAIARFLDRETAKIDALIAEQQCLIKLLQEKRQAVISHAVTKGLNPNAPMKDSGVEWLGEVPHHWAVCAVGYRYEVRLGKMLDEKRVTGQHLGPYLRNTDVQWESINTEDLPEMDFDLSEHERYSLKEGDLLVCEGGEVGRSAIWQSSLPVCFYQKALHRLRPLNASQDSARFQLYIMKMACSKGVFEASSGKATINHLPAEAFRRYRFAYPPFIEQQAISEHLSTACDEIRGLQQEASSLVSILQERRSALISAAVTGQIDVRGLVEAEVGEQ